MLFRLIYDKRLAQAAYLIGCQRTGEAIVVDPQRDIERYIEIAAAEGLKITAVTETHIHADFLSGAREIAERLGARVYLSAEGGSDWQYFWPNKRAGGNGYDHQLVKGGDSFSVGNIDFSVIHTPGHTPEHLSFLVTDRGSGVEEPMGIATGDFVFVGDVGRPDLLETAAGQSGAKEQSARDLYRSVIQFKNLPDYLQLWPGHGAGSACGKALGAVPQSTVGYEKKFNAAIGAAETETGFVQSVLEGQSEPPLYFGRMKRENKEGPAILGALPEPRHISLSEAKAQLGAGAALLDTRSWEEYRDGHLAGSMFAPLNTAFPTLAGCYVSPEQEVFLIVDPENLKEAVIDLIHVGLDQIKGYITPEDLQTHKDNGVLLVGSEEIDMTDLQSMSLSDAGLIIDVRGAQEWNEGHLEGAINMVHTRLRDNVNAIPRDKKLYVHCRSGVRSSYAVGFLESRGYNCVQLRGGYLEWVAANGPLA